MSTQEHVIEVTAADFESVVVENSYRVPVLVDFWADWCAPCKMQLPVLQKLAADFQGAFLVAKVNTESERELSAQHGIRNLPTMRLYRNGEVVEEIMGAQSEATLRALIEPYMKRESDRFLEQIMSMLQDGDMEGALTTLKSAHESDPDNHRLALEYARLCIQTGQLDTASTVTEKLPLEARDTPEATAVTTLLLFARAVVDAPDEKTLKHTLEAAPDTPDARYQLAARQVLISDYDAALENLMHLLQTNRAYADNAAQSALLAVFNLLGSKDERVTRYRRKMFTLLH